MDHQAGKYIIAAGIVIVLTGILVYFFHDYFKWIGKLPGDIRIEKENYRFYFPVVTMILISVAIMLIINIVKRFF
jgi:hypothetical protein